MTYSEFQGLCNEFHQRCPSIPARFAWKAISILHVDTMPVIPFGHLFANDKAYFTGTGQTGEFTGFIISDAAGVEYGVYAKQTIQYIDLTNVIAVSFNPNYNWVGETSMKAVFVENTPNNDDETTYTLKFYYDGLDHVDEGEQIEFTECTWQENAKITSVTKAVFTSSFVNARPTTCKDWFKGFSFMTTIEGMSNVNFSVVTTTESMFDGCYGLTDCGISGYADFSHLTNTKNMFNRCEAITKIKMTAWNMSQVTDATSMFSGCGELKKILATNTTPWEIAESENMFADCLQLPNYDETQVTCTKAYVGTGGYLTDAHEAKAVFDGTDTLTFYYDELEHAGTTYDLNSGAYEPGWVAHKLVTTTVVFDSTFSTVRPTTCYKWFNNFSKLTTITGISNLNTSSVTNMNGMFLHCDILPSLDVSGFNTTSVTTMMQMFADCRELTTLDVSNFVTSAVTDMSYMFHGCVKLTELDVSKFDVSNVTTMEHMFYGCYLLTGIFSNNTTAWSPANSTDMFMFCTSLPEYSDSKVTAEYAKVTTEGGYFTPKTAKVVFDGTNTLTFYYDREEHSGEGTIYSLNEGTTDPDWLTHSSVITTVTFDSSFANLKPSTCYKWFYNFTNLATINGLYYLDTTDVTNMDYMFYQCSSLETMYTDISTVWTPTSSIDMFLGCTSLNTSSTVAMPYDASKVTATYAHTGTDGYFTAPSADS